MTVRLDLQGRCGLVIGGTSEIGRACVQRLRDAGMTIGFTCSGGEHGESLARRTGATLIECDHGDRASTDRAVRQALELCGGRLDVLVVDPEMSLQGSIEATPEAGFRELLEVNLTSPFRVTRSCLPALRSVRGSIVLIASDAGIRAAHRRAAYSVASAGLIAVSELFAAEEAPFGVRCNAVCPGGMVDDELPPPSGRAGVGADVAATVAWLASDESTHMTGATLRLDGATGAAMVLDTRA